MVKSHWRIRFELFPSCCRSPLYHAMPGLSTWMLPLFVALSIVQRSCCSMACKMRRAKGDCGGWGQHSAVYCRLEMSNRFGWVCLHMHLAMVANRRKRETEFTVFADRDHAFVSQGFLPFLCRSLSLSLCRPLLPRGDMPCSAMQPNGQMDVFRHFIFCHASAGFRDTQTVTPPKSIRSHF